MRGGMRYKRQNRLLNRNVIANRATLALGQACLRAGGGSALYNCFVVRDKGNYRLFKRYSVADGATPAVG